MFLVFKFPYNAGTPDVGADFGKVSVYSWNQALKAYDSNLLLLPAKFVGSLKTKNNYNWLDNTEANGFGMVHSQEDAAITAISASNYGVKYKPGTNQRLVFTLRGDPAVFGTTNQVGFTLYANANILKSKINIAAPATYKSAEGFGGPVLRGRASEDLGAEKSWTKIEIWASNVFNLKLGMMDNGVTRTFGLKDFEVVNQAGPYADQFNFDLYGGTYDNYEATKVFRNNFAINAYTISSTPIGNKANTGNIKLSVVNFWTGTAGNGNLDGTKFPFFTRVMSAGGRKPTLLS